MALNQNFFSAEIDPKFFGQGPTLVVEGKGEGVGGKTFVAVRPDPAKPEADVAEVKNMHKGAWQADFPAPKGRYKEGDQIRVVGIELQDDGLPIVWFGDPTIK